MVRPRKYENKTQNQIKSSWGPYHVREKHFHIKILRECNCNFNSNNLHYYLSIKEFIWCNI